MGMGEPFANYDATPRALKLLNAGRAPTSARATSRSPPAASCRASRSSRPRASSSSFPVSLTRRTTRSCSQLMPVNRRWPSTSCWRRAAPTRARRVRDHLRIHAREGPERLARVRGGAGAPPEDAAGLQGEPDPAFAGQHRPTSRRRTEATQLAFLDALMKARIQGRRRAAAGRDVAARARACVAPSLRAAGRRRAEQNRKG